MIMTFCGAGCVGIETFPLRAQAGDTVTVGLGLGYTEYMNSFNTSVTITNNPATNPNTYNSGLIIPRSVFNLYPDPRSKVANYNVWLPTNIMDGTPLETGVVFDLPTNIPPGNYLARVDRSMGGAFVDLALVVTAGTGSPNQFKNETGPQNINDLENLPGVEVNFSAGKVIGAADLVIDFNQAIVTPNNINVVQPRINFGKDYFQNHQRLFFWNDNGDVLKVRILCPRGVDSKYLKFYIVRPAIRPIQASRS